jgi:hypothetical protein
MLRNSTTYLVFAVIGLCLAGAAAWYAFRPAPASDKLKETRPPEKKDDRVAAVDPLELRFTNQVRPFLKRYCFECHGSTKPEADLDLSHDDTVAAVVKNARSWEKVVAKLAANKMPPDDAEIQPAAEERAAVIAWLRELHERETLRSAGDPGPVLARRLSNAEFDNTIRDLTGVEIRPAREFPVDPANEAGFDNSGESLAMSPALLNKYLAAARRVAEHAVLKPDGFDFAPHPMIADTDRDKYCVQRIVDFYERHRVDLADYFLVAWKFRHREALGKPTTTLGEIAQQSGLSVDYLDKVWALLTDDKAAAGPLTQLREEWGKLPTDASKSGEARRDCEKLRDLVLRLRKDLAPKVDNLSAKGISSGSQSFILWRNRQLAAQNLRSANEAAARFCRVFPFVFFALERAPYYDAGSSPKGRLLSAGFHLMHGYFRDDGPLYELILNNTERREIDALWRELNFITLSPQRQYKDFIFFERAEPPRFMFEAEFDFARSEDKDCASEAKMERLAKLYLAKARSKGASPEALKAIEDYFVNISAEIREVERARLAAEPSHLEALTRFAERAYRRPLTHAERDDLLAFYRKLRSEDLSHEDALRDTIASVLLSPHFCYQIVGRPSVASGTVPLTDHELASRLSYFLWSSMPDDELLAHAAKGDLHDPVVLTAQTRRMLRDPKVRGLATEFAGNWLDFRRFEEHNAVDRERFPSFTNELRQAMFEEPLRYFMDVAQHDRSVLALFDGNDTFVNPVLAKHYGMPPPENNEWIHIENAGRFGRGGLLPMAVFLTKNAPGLRTSPVKRGYWIVRRVLGEEIPPPPPTVPELPKDEANLGALTLPQLLARHRADKACAGCHNRFDSVGLAFEGFGPIGERRAKDLGDKPVQTSATFPDGKARDGVDGLRDYLREVRRDDFIDNFCRKLFAYALGRGLLPSDKPALDEMRAKLKADGYRFGSLVEAIVGTKQFLNKRGPENVR